MKETKKCKIYLECRGERIYPNFSDDGSRMSFYIESFNKENITLDEIQMGVDSETLTEEEKKYVLGVLSDSIIDLKIY